MAGRIAAFFFLFCAVGVLIYSFVVTSDQRQKVSQAEIGEPVRMKIHVDQDQSHTERGKDGFVLQDTSKYFHDFFSKINDVSNVVEAEENKHIVVTGAISRIDPNQTLYFDVGAGMAYCYNPSTKKMMISVGVLNAINGVVDSRSIKKMKTAIDLELLKKKHNGHTWRIACGKMDFDGLPKDMGSSTPLCILRKIEITDRGYVPTLHGDRIDVSSGSFSYYSFEIMNINESIWKWLSGYELSMEPSDAMMFIPSARIFLGVSPLGYQHAGRHVVGDFEPTKFFPYALNVMDYRIQAVLKEIIVFDKDNRKVIVKEIFQ